MHSSYGSGDKEYKCLTEALAASAPEWRASFDKLFEGEDGGDEDGVDEVFEAISKRVQSCIEDDPDETETAYHIEFIVDDITQPDSQNGTPLSRGFEVCVDRKGQSDLTSFFPGSLVWGGSRWELEENWSGEQETEMGSSPFTAHITQSSATVPTGVISTVSPD